MFLGAELAYAGALVLGYAAHERAIAALPRQWLVRREEQEEPAETAPAWDGARLTPRSTA